MRKIAGIDVSRGSVTVIVLSEIPEDLRRIQRKPVKLKCDSEGVQKLLEMEFDCAVLEPTGMHYSKLWAHHLREAGREVRWVDHQEIANYRKSWKVSNKTDQLDAIALACYGLERYERPSHFVRADKENLRTLWLQLKHLNRSKNPTVNRLRQQLAAEFPEVSERQVERKWLVTSPPGLWLFVSGEHASAKWQKEYADSVGVGISAFSRGLAAQICAIERQEFGIEQEIAQELERTEYAPYLKIFEDYAFGERTATALLSAIYPLEQFLKDGRKINEYIESASGTRGRRDRSLGAFKLRCGLGMTYYQSGDSQGWKASGSADTRTALWLWCKIAVVMRPNLELPKIAKLRSYYDHGSKQIIDGEEKVFHPGIRNQKVLRVVRRALEMLYRDLIKTVK
jgi:hypothetical protein